MRSSPAVELLPLPSQPDVFISLGARAKIPGESMIGGEVELIACQQSGEEMSAYERLLSDTVRGIRPFCRMDGVEAAWRIVDPILGNVTPVYQYEPNTWGPSEANRIIGDDTGWHNPMPSEESDERSCSSL